MKVFMDHQPKSSNTDTGYEQLISGELGFLTPHDAARQQVTSRRQGHEG
jgi:hypothetical protein